MQGRCDGDGGGGNEEAVPEGGEATEKAQVIAAHKSLRTTKPYDRTSDEITLDEIERIVI